MDSHSDVTVNGEDTYRVEVSGWDAKENFFVEKTTLEWKPEDKKSMLLRADIRPGCIVFVRLLQPLATATSFPIAYEALTGAEKDMSGAARVSLERLRPRATYKETFGDGLLAVRVAYLDCGGVQSVLALFAFRSPELECEMVSR